jgi:hypothetical protein
MSKLFISILSGVLIGLVIWYTFLYKPESFNTKPYESKIDSLQKQVDSFLLKNDSLSNSIKLTEESNLFLAKKNQELKIKVSKLKYKTIVEKPEIKYTPTQVDSFFKEKYPAEYKKYSIDTTKLPIEVSKSIVSDIKECEVNKNVILIQDTIINNLDSLVIGKDSVITLLKDKDLNNQNIIKTQKDQTDNYKILVTGLKDEIKFKDKKLKFQKIERIIMGIFIIGLFLGTR